MAFITLIPMGPNEPIPLTQTPERNVPAQLTFIGLRIDRTQLTGPTTGTLAELEILLSVDDGATWGGTWTDTSVEPHKQYPLRVAAGIPDGEILGRNGLPVPFSAVGVPLPPTGQARKLRASYRVLKAATFAVILETR